nr:hypothetical protein [Tanacetum cinerariifolium]
MIVNSIENGPYVRRMIATPGEPDLPVSILESFHEQIYKELTENDLKWMDADDQAIQTILLGLLEDIYATVDSYEIAKEIWERVRQMMKGSDNEEQEKKAKLFNELEKFTIDKFRMLEEMVGISFDNMLDKWHRISKGLRVLELGIKPDATTAEDWVILLGIALPDQGEGMLVIFRLSCSLLKRKKQGYNFKQKNLTSWLLQASKSGTQHDKAPVYDIDGSAENDNHVTSVSLSMVQSGGKIEISFPLNEETCAHRETVYRNLVDQVAQLRARVFKNTSESMKNTSRTSVTPHVDKSKLSAVTPLSKKLHASMPSHSVPQPIEFNVMKHRNVIAPGMFKINLFQMPRVDLVPNKQSSASIRTNPITNCQRYVTLKENVSSNMVTASSTRLVHTARTRRPQPKGNTRNARVPSTSKSSKVKKNVTVEEYRRTLLLSKNQKTMSFECNNIKLAIQNDKSDKSEIVCVNCKQCLVTANHDACVLSHMNALNSHANNMCANVRLVKIKRDIGHIFGN